MITRRTRLQQSKLQKLEEVDRTDDDERTVHKQLKNEKIITENGKHDNTNIITPLILSSSSILPPSPAPGYYQLHSRFSPSLSPLSSPPFSSNDNVFRRHVDFIEQPRQLVFLLLMCAFLLLYTWNRKSDTDPEDLTRKPLWLSSMPRELLLTIRSNVQAALAGIVIVFLTYSSLQLRDGLVVRPHPIMWRLIHACILLYVLALSAILAQSLPDARAFLSLMFDDIYVPTPNHSHVPIKDCSLSASAILRQITSVWMFSHTIGWWCKMLIFRDWQMCWIQSILFELLEISLQFLIPDFRECWWDSLFIDALGANMLGMWMGYHTLLYVNSRLYSWGGRDEQRPLHQVIIRFTPISWSIYHWETFHSFTRLSLNFIIIVATLTLEITCFFLMHSLGIPPTNPIPKIRLSLLGLLSIPAAAEYYEYITNPHCHRIGMNAWLAVVMCVMELLVTIKFSRGVWLEPVRPPIDIWGPWLGFFVLFGIWCAVYFYRKFQYNYYNKKNEQSVEEIKIKENEQINEMIEQDNRSIKVGTINSKNIIIGNATILNDNNSILHLTNHMTIGVDKSEEMRRVFGWLDVLFYLSFTPLLLLCRLWVWK